MVQQPVSVGVAYVLWFFLGGLGVHKFYLKQAVMGVVMLVLWIGGIILSATLIGALIVLVWRLIRRRMRYRHLPNHIG